MDSVYIKTQHQALCKQRVHLSSTTPEVNIGEYVLLTPHRAKKVHYSSYNVHRHLDIYFSSNFFHYPMSYALTILRQPKFSLCVQPVAASSCSSEEIYICIDKYTNKYQ